MKVVQETIVTGTEVENAILDNLKIDEYNCVRFFDGDREVFVKDLKAVIYNEVEEDMAECIYCEPHKKCSNDELHFVCEICGNGMCDDCYDSMVEHDGHYHLPLENCDDEREIELITEACENDNPDYICEDCMNKVLKESEDE